MINCDSLGPNTENSNKLILIARLESASSAKAAVPECHCTALCPYYRALHCVLILSHYTVSLSSDTVYTALHCVLILSHCTVSLSSDTVYTALRPLHCTASIALHCVHCTALRPLHCTASIALLCVHCTALRPYSLA